VTDYGHDLLFGAFITPGAQEPRLAVALAQFAEQAGLDLATFQDHPYQPGFLDTWTLLSYAAASTQAIRLAPNVLNLPLRQPAVVARSAASLDLLSGGRFELGLGAGAFWDAIAAMGGRRLSPPQALAALTEAIAVIRGIWHPGQPGVLRVDGEFYQVNGAKRGPAPAHDIGIWLGAYKPRMLALTGQAADGWLPSLGYLQPEELAAGNAIIDEAATAAGREPAAIRRLLNISGELSARSSGFLHGPPGQWAEELAALALTDGISAFILGGDDPAALERFGQEIAPAVRDLVDTERRRRADATAVSAPAATSPAAASRQTGASPGAAAADGEARTAGAGAAPGASGGGAPAALGLTPTPDTGERLTGVRLWDEATRPSAPAAPAGAAYSRRGRAVGAHLIEVHDHLRAELGRVRDLIEQVRSGALEAAAARSAINEMTMRQNDWTLGAYCASYCRVVTGHHTLEDEGIFPHLRSAEPGLAPVIDRLADEHKVIHQVLSDVDQALVALLRNPDDFSGLQHAVDVLTDTLLSHLAYEEAQLVEPLARHGFYRGQL
jgi:alkanesulfonate monooxygenase SsuD/methylene tetrahydromethanopterin reductase-like flavin-dependent oxidoreductase (luciferase family)